jgi:hypothetical protein
MADGRSNNPQDTTSSPAWRAWITPDVVAVVAAIVVVLVGADVSKVRFRDVGGAILFVGIVTATAGAASWLATQKSVAQIRSAAHDAETAIQDRAFQLVALQFRGPASTPNGAIPFSILTREDVATIERTAREVWVYAVDLQWDVDQEALSSVIHDNLTEDKRYRYLIPSGIEASVREMVYRNREVAHLETRLCFCARPDEIPFAPHGIAIYNPRLLNEHACWPDPCVVLFSHHGEPGDGFVEVRGQFVKSYERAFDELWRRGEGIAIDGYLTEYRDQGY